MIVFIFLCAFFSQAYAANYSEEAKKESTFKFACNKYGTDGYKPIENFMMKEGFHGEYQDFFDIAEDQTLSDSKKLKKKRVFTKSKYFQELAKKDQKKRNDVLEALLNVVNDPTYCYGRVLLAACVYTRPDVNTRAITGLVLEKALLKDDVSLVQIALEYGANSNAKEFNGGHIMANCESVQAAQLMVEHGVNVSEVGWGILKRDLVYAMCFCGKGEKANELIRYYLDYIKPSESNEYGLKWMTAVSKNSAAASNIIEYVKVLLEYDCKYTEKVKKKLCKKVGKESAQLQGEMEQVFDNHENKSKNIKPAKR